MRFDVGVVRAMSWDVFWSQLTSGRYYVSDDLLLSRNKDMEYEDNKERHSHSHSH